MQLKQFVFNPFQENTYLAICEETKECVVVDCGVLMRHEEETLMAFVKGNGLKVKGVLNTHLHLDHCFGNAWAADTYGVKPMAHADDEQMLDGMVEHAAACGLKMDVRVQSLGGYLTEEEEVVVGNGRLRVIHTPGHTRGGVCLYCEEAGFLLSGDTLFQQSIGRTDLPGGDYATLIRSVQQKIFCLPENVVVYPGHGMSTTVGEEKEFNPFF